MEYHAVLQLYKFDYDSMIVVLLKKLYIEIPVLKTRIDCPL